MATHVRTSAAVIAAAALVLLTGCASSGTATGSREVTIATSTSPANLDFTTNAGAAIAQALLYNVYETLVKVDGSGEIVPLLAESYDVGEDGLDYTFTLHDDLAFTNGSPLDADAVVFSIGRLSEWTNSIGGKLSAIDTVTATSDTEVAFHLSRIDNEFLFNLASVAGAVFSPDAVDALATTAVGSGPYEVVSYDTNATMAFEANEEYWGGAPELDRITIEYISDANALTTALLGGSADLVMGARPEQLAQFEDDDRFRVSVGTSNGETVMSMNNAAAPFDDVRVRQAFLYAIDREEINDAVTDGQGTLIGSFVPPTDPYYEDLSELYPYDPEMARQLLAEAGQENLTVEFTVPNQTDNVAAAQIIQSQLAEVGVTVNVSTVEFPGVWLEKVLTNHDYQMSIINHIEPRDIGLFATPDYYLGYSNEEADALYAAALAAPTNEEYVETMKQFARKIADDAAADFLWLSPSINVAVAELEGVPTNATSQSYDFSNLRYSS